MALRTRVEPLDRDIAILVLAAGSAKEKAQHTDQYRDAQHTGLLYRHCRGQHVGDSSTQNGTKDNTKRPVAHG